MIDRGFIADNYTFAGLLTGLCSLIKKAVSEKSQLDDVCYTIAIRRLLTGGEVGEAYALFRQMKEVGLAPSKQTYNLILSSFCKRSDVSMVEEILLEMVDASVEVDHFSLRFMKNLLYRSRHSASLSTLLTDGSTSGILPKEAYAELFNELVQPVNIRNVHTDRSTNIDFGTSSSDEIQEVVVSVG
ncbi:hypothetical protein P3S67_025220 [Capsicum chacoense]